MLCCDDIMWNIKKNKLLMIGNCPTETPHLKLASLLSLAVCVTPVKRSKDSVLTKMADVCSKMVDGEWGGGVNFPAPVLDHSLLSEPDSRPAEAGALCSFPEQFSRLINCSPRE